MPLAHLAIPVQDETAMQQTLNFYLIALAPLGHKEMFRPHSKVVGLGQGQIADFWIGVKEGASTTHGLHFAFMADSKELCHSLIDTDAQDRQVVQDFHEAAMKAGAKDNGTPGLRPHYHESYFGAFVFDNLGNNIEAVTFSPQ